jgi:O-antigen ligase
MIAKRGIGYMLSNPFLGVGIANFQKAECTISDKAKNHRPGTGLRCMPPHNSFVEVGAETGITGLVLWSSLIFGGIWSLRRMGKRLPRRWRNGNEEQRFLYYACQYVPVALVGFGATAYFLSFAWLEPYYMLAAITASTLYCANQARLQEYQRVQQERAARPPRTAPALVPATPIPAVAAE